DREANFKKMVQVVFRFLKTKHHLVETERDPGPRSLNCAADWLGQLVRPAQPTEFTTTMLGGNARNLLGTSLIILRNHYQDTLRGLTTEIQGLDLSEFQRAWEVAVKWTRRNLMFIREGTIQRASVEIGALAETQLGRQREQRVEVEMDVTPEGDDAAQAEMRDRLKRELQEELRQELMEELRAEFRAELDWDTGVEEQPLNPRPQREKARKKSNPTLRALVSQEGPGEPRLAPGDAVLQSRSLDLLASPGAQAGEPVPAAQKPLQEGVEGEPNPQIQTVVIEEVDEDWEALFGEMTEGTGTGSVEKRKGAEQPGPSMGHKKKSEGTSGEGPTHSLVPLRRVSIEQVGGPDDSLHQKIEHMGNRKVNWVLIPLRPILIIGDSNIARIPPFKDGRAQLVAYPGAQWSHVLWTLQHRHQRL
ncbi:putative proline-rich receptor-like protein kinase PERK2, partial [Triplophysa rosa]